MFAQVLHNISLFALTETWLRDVDAAHKAEATPSGFKLVDHPRRDRCSRGTGLLLRDTLEVEKIAASERQSFEFSEWRVGSGSRRLRLVVIYMPSYTHNHRVTITAFFN